MYIQSFKGRRLRKILKAFILLQHVAEIDIEFYTSTYINDQDDETEIRDTVCPYKQ